MVDVPNKGQDLGEEFEYESQLSKQELVQFLEELVDQLKQEDKVTVSVLGAEGSFPFREPIDLELDCDYVQGGKRELEIEIEFQEQQ